MPSRTDRIEARVTPERADRIRQAAALEGLSMSAFVVDAAADRAERVLRRWRETVVSSEYFDRLLAALDEPAEPNPALERAAQRAWENVIRSDAPSGPVPKRTSSRKPRTR